MSRVGLGETSTNVTAAAKTSHKVAIEVSSDHLQAWISPTNPNGPLPLTIEETVCALKEAKIIVDEKVLERVKEFVAISHDCDEKRDRFLVAKGCSAVECKDESFQQHESFLQQEQDWQGDAAVNYYTYNSVHLVKKDDPIGSLLAAVAGVNGVDVFGKVLSPHGHPKEVELKSSVRKSDHDPTIVLANNPGQIEFSNNVLSINEVLTVANDVDFETGSIDSPVDVLIHGTVHDSFVVKSERAVTIDGAIESATIEAKHDVIVRGGILQKGRSSISSGQDIVAKFCDEANLRAAGDVKICKELMNSHVRCEGKLFAAQGAVIGGDVYAREGVEVAALGSDANVKTEVAVGIHPDVTEEAERIRQNLDAKRVEAERIRSSLQPLMADMKRLSPEQKEKATELMFGADAMDTEVAEGESQCSTMLQDARAQGTPFVLVTKVIHEGVTIRIGRRITSFSKVLAGPVRIEKRKIKNVTEFVAINQLSGSISVLPSSYAVVKPREQAVELIDQGRGRDDGQGR